MASPEDPIPQKVLALPTPTKLRNRGNPDSSYVEEHDTTYDATYVSESESDVSADDTTYEDNDITKSDIEEYIVVEDEEFVALAEKEPQTSFYDFLVRNEIPRKVFHSFHGFLTLFLYCNGYLSQQITLPLWILFFVMLANDLIRFNFPSVNRHLVRWMGFIIRKSEVDSWNGVVFYLLGLALVFSVAPKDIAVMSVLLLSWADTAASTIGRKFGKYTPQIRQGKSLAGCLASGFTGLVACYLFYGYYVPKYSYYNKPGDLMWTPETSRLSIHAYAAVCAVAASVSEAIDVGLDDNFTIPVFGSILLAGSVWLARY